MSLPVDIKGAGVNFHASVGYRISAHLFRRFGGSSEAARGRFFHWYCIIFPVLLWFFCIGGFAGVGFRDLWDLVTCLGFLTRGDVIVVLGS